MKVVPISAFAFTKQCSKQDRATAIRIANTVLAAGGSAAYAYMAGQRFLRNMATSQPPKGAA